MSESEIDEIKDEMECTPPEVSRAAQDVVTQQKQPIHKTPTIFKKQNETHTPKKSRVFTRNQFEEFLSQAPEEKYLGMKVVLIIGVCGACRCDEMIKMRIMDIEDKGSLIYMKIPDTKPNKARAFTIVGEKYLTVVRKYISLRPEGIEEQRLFLRYNNGKSTRVVMGVH